MNLFGKSTFILVTLCCLVPIFFAIPLWSQIPDPCILHINEDLEPIEWGGKVYNVVGFPLLMAVVAIVCGIIGMMSPTLKGVNDKAMYAISWAPAVASMVSSGSCIVYALGYFESVNNIVYAVFGIIFIALGNSLAKLYANRRFGLRTEAGLLDPYIWKMTNVSGGISFCVGGVAFMGLSVYAVTHPQAVWEIIYPLAVIVIIFLAIPYIVSYVLSKKRKDVLDAAKAERDAHVQEQLEAMERLEEARLEQQKKKSQPRKKRVNSGNKK